MSRLRKLCQGSVVFLTDDAPTRNALGAEMMALPQAAGRMEKIERLNGGET